VAVVILHVHKYEKSN